MARPLISEQRHGQLIDSQLDKMPLVEQHGNLLRSTHQGSVPFVVAHYWGELITSTGIDDFSEVLKTRTVEYQNKWQQEIIGSYLGVEAWLQDDTPKLTKLFESLLGTPEAKLVSADGVNAQAYMRLLGKLLFYKEHHKVEYQKQFDETLVIIGDSHTLALSNRIIYFKNKSYLMDARPIRGIKLHHLGSGKPAKYRKYFEHHIANLKTNSDLALVVGEIDARPDEGIFQYCANHTDVDTKAVTANTVVDGCDYIDDVLQKNWGLYDKNKITVVGFSRPGYLIQKRLPLNTDESSFVQFQDHFNSIFRQKVLSIGWNYLDALSLTNKMNSEALQKYRIDRIHLNPSFYDLLFSI